MMPAHGGGGGGYEKQSSRGAGGNSKSCPGLQDERRGEERRGGGRGDGLSKKLGLPNRNYTYNSMPASRCQHPYPNVQQYSYTTDSTAILYQQVGTTGSDAQATAAVGSCARGNTQHAAHTSRQPRYKPQVSQSVGESVGRSICRPTFIESFRKHSGRTLLCTKTGRTSATFTTQTATRQSEQAKPSQPARLSLRPLWHLSASSHTPSFSVRRRNNAEGTSPTRATAAPPFKASKR